MMTIFLLMHVSDDLLRVHFQHLEIFLLRTWRDFEG